jgi:hypothetical protein
MLNDISLTINCNHRIAATLYTQESVVCFGFTQSMSVTSQKGLTMSSSSWPRRVVTVEENDLNTKYRPVDILLNVLRCHLFHICITAWQRYCATSRKVVGSSPDGALEIMHWPNISGRTVALGSTQSVTEMSARDLSRGIKVAGVWGWQSCHFHVPIISPGSLNLLEPSGSV